MGYSPWGLCRTRLNDFHSLTHIAFIHVPGVVLHRLNVLTHLIISTTPLQGSYYGISLSLCRVLSRVGLCDPMDRIPPGSSLHGIPQARMLEWVAISFSAH